MDERINSLTPYLRKAIVDAARKGAEAAVEKLFDEQRAEAAKLMKKQQSKKFKKLAPRESRTETYPISVRMHGGHHGQQSAEVRMDGIEARIMVEERLYGPMPSRFVLTFYDADSNSERLDDSDTFESGVQRAVVAILSHAWYGGK